MCFAMSRWQPFERPFFLSVKSNWPASERSVRDAFAVGLLFALTGQGRKLTINKYYDVSNRES